MLVIREPQLRALEDAYFERWLGAELGQRFPKPCLALGPSGVSEFIRGSVSRANGLGFGRDEWLRFAGMELVFGAGFFDHPGWAQNALAAARAALPAARLQALVEAAVFHLAESAGESTGAAGVGALDDAAPDEGETESPPGAYAYTEEPEPAEMVPPSAVYPEDPEMEAPGESLGTAEEVRG